MLKIINYSKAYNKNKFVIKNLNLEIKQGEVFGFIGPNGAGKTTTIKSICGILDFEEGDILINGNSIRTNPKNAKLDLAYIPDNPDIYQSMTGIQYLNFVANVFNVDMETRRKLIEDYSTRLTLKERLNDSISSYSHGMKQKLIIISALIHSPKLLILDEPFVGLDPKATFEVKKIMRELCDKGSAIFFSTHVLEVAEKICDKIAIIFDGKIVKEGKVKDVVEDKSLEDIFLKLVER